MNATDKHINKFLTLFHAFENSLNGEKSKPFHEWRRTAIDRLQQLSFPRRKDEEWKYTPVTRIVSPTYSVPPQATLTDDQLAKTQVENLDALRLVFVNGQFQADVSDAESLPKGVQMLSMAEASNQKSFRSLIEELLIDTTENGEDPFVTLNTAFSKDSLFLHVDRNAVIDRPIHLVNINTKEEQAFFVNPQKLFYIESGAQVTFVESYQSTSPEAVYFNNVVNRVHVGANAKMHHYRLQTESPAAFQINNTDIYQDRDSVYSHYNVDLGGRMIRNNLNAYHQGENVTSNFYGGFMGRNEQHIDSHTLVDHRVPNCQSNELYKGILTDKARGVFNGKVIVHKDAQKTNAFQQNSSLLLSDNAVMDAKPQLEIFADDVKCSHGATIGQLDEESVFYLRSRGLTDQKARETLQTAFLLEVMDLVPHQPLREHMGQLITNKLAEATPNL